jgi:hypothetical protein
VFERSQLIIVMDPTVVHVARSKRENHTLL